MFFKVEVVSVCLISFMGGFLTTELETCVCVCEDWKATITVRTNSHEFEAIFEVQNVFSVRGLGIHL